MKVSSVLPHETILLVLDREYGFFERVEQFRYQQEVWNEFPINCPGLADAVERAKALYPQKAFISKKGCTDNYTHLALTYDPEFAAEDLHDIGTRTLHNEEMRYADVFNRIVTPKRGYYSDTYGFRALTPAMKLIAPHLPKFKRSLVRSRLSVLDGMRPETNGFSFGWHTDEIVFSNLRINIPITCPEGYVIQVEANGLPPIEGSPTIKSYPMREGYAYSWNTNLPHRPCALREVPQLRTNLVIGVSPWFDYDPIEDSWTPNEFFGRKHPFQMLHDGDIIDWS